MFSALCKIQIDEDSNREETFTFIRCKSTDGATEHYFLHLMNVFLAAVGPSPSTNRVAEGVLLIAGMFQKIASPPKNTVIGLIGELVAIKMARSRLAAICAWRQDPDERYDFAVGQLRVDAKATTTRSRKHLFSHSQTDIPVDCVGVVASSFVELIPGGTQLCDYLGEIERDLNGNFDALFKLQTVVVNTLGRDLPIALTARFDRERAHSSLAFFDLNAIPAIRGPLPPGVSEVKFSSDLSRTRPVSNNSALGLSSTEEDFFPP